jgi:hypothetical protein
MLKHASWHCLECYRTGSPRDPAPPERMAAQHAEEARHLVEVTTTVAYLPAERS